VPTHVHPNFARLHFADIGDDYVPYNKPGSIKHWLEHGNVTEDIVFFIDADMIFLKCVLRVCMPRIVCGRSHLTCPPNTHTGR
jgi:hypothetical protein